MDFDLFLEETRKRTLKTRKLKKVSRKMNKERVESAILDDKCVEIPQNSDGRRAYK